MIVAGIDPGLNGGVAAIDGTGKVFVSAMPMPLNSRETGGVDGKALLAWLKEKRPYWIYIEQVHSMPKQGVASSFKFGFTTGYIEGCCTAYLISENIPVTNLVRVSPQRWMKAIHLPVAGDTKTRSIATAKKLFPRVNLLASNRCRVEHDGMAEALLIAEYGRQTVTCF